ncbi:MAG: phytoene desaturase family protein [Candidatus Dadabacteria bacterium]
MQKRDYDAIVVGSGPNGLAAAITLQKEGLSVLLIEGKETVGGGMRSAELTLPGFVHDVCSAIHPLAAGSPFFKTLPLEKHGLEFIYPPVAAAHPFEDGRSAALYHSVIETATNLGQDKLNYLQLMQPLVHDWPRIANDVLGPFQFPTHPVEMARFGWNALRSASSLASRFITPEAKGLLGGMAAHSIQPLTNVATAAIAMVLLTAGHTTGWPVAKGGSQSIANALASYFTSIGGTIQTNFYVRNLDQLPGSHALLFDVTPQQLMAIAGDKFSSLYKWQLQNYRYGMGVFKIDWALNGPIPFTSPVCRETATVHLGNTMEEIAVAEQLTSLGQHPGKPFVLLAQQSLFDDTRAPAGKHTAWAYCHVPNGSMVDMTQAIESQVERFAPGFRDLILSRHVMTAAQMEQYNPNYIGGDINGGIIDITQLFSRPALRLSPYRTSSEGIYICSSSTPPGGGVHGMCGYHAAKRALKDVFHLRVSPLQ